MPPSKVHVFFFLNTSKKKKKEIIRIFILKTSNVRTKYIYTLDKNKNKNQYACSGIFKV